MKNKNKIIIITIVISLALGLAYQNCGTTSNTSNSDQTSKMNTSKTLFKSESRDFVTLVLEDGTRIKMQPPKKDNEPRILVLKDGTRIKLGVK